MKILVLSHNTPFPPNKGDKIRAFHMIRGLAESHEVHLLSLSKDPLDVRYLDELRRFCTTAKIFPLHRLLSKVFALLCLLTPFPLTFGFFYSRAFKRELMRVLRTEEFDLVLVFCSSTAQYVRSFKHPPIVIDFVDIDSAKWAEYAKLKNFPASWIYGIEHRRLSRWEVKLHRTAACSLLTTHRERARLLELSDARPNTESGSENAIVVVPNGIDIAHYRREFEPSIQPVVMFTGQMDYLPNIDAVVFFYLNIWPLITAQVPHAEFHIVGRNPNPELRTICATAFVSGEVDDVRLYMRSARVFVAPLRLSFGSQYKVLEAMASGIPVVTTSNVLSGLQAVVDRDLLIADEPTEFAAHVVSLLRDEKRANALASRGLAFVQNLHDWSKISRDLNRVLCEVVSEDLQRVVARTR